MAILFTAKLARETETQRQALFRVPDKIRDRNDLQPKSVEDT